MPNYYCQGSAELVDDRGARHMNAGGQAIDAAVAEAFLAALRPAALQACLQAAEQIEQGRDAALDQHRRQVEQAPAALTAFTGSTGPGGCHRDSAGGGFGRGGAPR